MILSFLWAGLGVATLLQLWFWAVRFGYLAHYQLPTPDTDKKLPPVSIIICARNEEKNIRKNLPYFLEQEYPTYEVIVVDDNSTDKTSQVVLDFQKNHPTLCLVSITEETPPGKKRALSLGIKTARFNWLFLSDADCRPLTRQWLKITQQLLTSGIELSLGYSPYHKRDGWLNRFIRFEAFYTAIQYFSFSLSGHPYMGVGRNLVYRKRLFQRAKGFSQHAHLMSGDDDLLVNQMATAENTAIHLHPETSVSSTPISTWRRYYIQKRRHLSVGQYYRKKDLWALGALSVSHAAFYGLGGLLLALQPQWWATLTVIYLVRMGVVLYTCVRASRHLGQRDLLLWLPLLDLAFLGYYFLFVPSFLTGRRIKRWK